MPYYGHTNYWEIDDPDGIYQEPPDHESEEMDMSTRLHCYRPMIAVEEPSIYDGACWWLCAQCGMWSHRFEQGDPRRGKVEMFMAHARHREIGREVAE